MKNGFNKIFVLLSIGVFLVILLAIIGLINYYYSSEIPQGKVKSPPESFCGTTDYSKVLELGLRFNKTGEMLFKEDCAPCHSIDKIVVGPKLKDLDKKHSDKWLHQFIRNPKRLILSEDVEAIKIYKEFNEILMPEFEFLSEPQIDSILAYVKFESAVIRK